MHRRYALYVVTMLPLVCFVNVAAQAQEPSHPQSPEFQVWRTVIKNTRLPHKGCFKASFPAIEWREVACQKSPDRPIGNPESRTPEVGSGYDFVGTVTGQLTSAIGSFPVLTNVTSSNAYSLQVNSNVFPTSAFKCGTADCTGWQQFVYDQKDGSAYMQYWLIGYLAYYSSCPSGWIAYGDSCYKNSTVVGAPQNMSITQLVYTSLEGSAYGGTDELLLETYDGSASATGADTVLNLEQGWNATYCGTQCTPSAEFNVFGDGSGSQVTLNSGATLLVQIYLNNGTNAVPGFDTSGTTGETNNLNLVASAPCLYGGTSTMMQFVESNTTATQTCGVSGANSVEMSSTSFNFIGKPSTGWQYKTATITNETSSTITIESQVVNYGNGGYFYWEDCPTSLPPNGSCITSVGFDFVAYAQNESFYATLTITTSVGTVGARLSAYVK